MTRSRRRLAAALAILLVAPAAQAAETPRASTLSVLEGTVVARDLAKAEAGLDVVRVQLKTGDGLVHVLLAPPKILEEIDFPVEPGDRFRARVFDAAPGQDAAAHKVMNLTKDRMVRLRTLNHDPVWDNDGNWQGGRRHRHGKGAPPEGAGPGPRAKRGRGGR